MEYALLAEIDRRQHPGLPDLAADFHLDRSTLRYRLLPLERAGLIETEVDSRDARSRRVRLTEAGRTKLAAALPLWLKAQSAFEEAMGASEADAMRATAHQLTSGRFAEAFARSEEPTA